MNVSDTPAARVDVPQIADATRPVIFGFTEFYDLERDRLGRLLALALNNADLGFEAVDEAMTRACQRWGEVSSLGNPSGWVYRVAMNWATSRLRRVTLWHRKKTMLVERDEAPDATESIADPELAAALERLNQDQRVIVVLRFYGGWPLDDIAHSLDLPLGTVKSRLNRAMKTLRAELEEAS